MATSKGITRREIIKGAAAATAAASIGTLTSCHNSMRVGQADAAADRTADLGARAAVRDVAPGNADPSSPVQGRSTVVTIQNDDSLVEAVHVGAVQGMVDFMLSAVAGGVSNPWSKLLSDADPAFTRVGLKINCLNAMLTTSPILVRAIINSLVTKGRFVPSNIVVWDRSLQDINGARSKFTDEVLQGARAAGTCEGFAPDGSPLVGSGPGYGDSWDDIEGRVPPHAIRLSRILTEQTDVTINCPVLKAHPETGFTAALKNCYGMFDNPGNYHKPYLTTALPKIYAIPPIRNSVKLTIVDSILASTGGNRADRTPGRISASLDPLALDFYALDLCNQLCAMRPGVRAPIDPRSLAWMDQAYRIGIGAKKYSLVSLDVNGNVARISDSDSVDGGMDAT